MQTTTTTYTVHEYLLTDVFVMVAVDIFRKIILQLKKIVFRYKIYIPVHVPHIEIMTGMQDHHGVAGRKNHTERDNKDHRFNRELAYRPKHR